MVKERLKKLWERTNQHKCKCTSLPHPHGQALTHSFPGSIVSQTNKPREHIEAIRKHRTVVQNNANDQRT